MEELFKGVFFLVRIPFFLLGVFVWTFFVPFMLGYALIIVPILGIPFAFLRGVFSNNPRLMGESLSDMTHTIGDIAGGAVGGYGGVFFWWVGVKRANEKSKKQVGFVIFIIIFMLACLYILGARTSL